jgi:hypothetical protein
MSTAQARAMPFRPRIAIALATSTDCTSIADWLTAEGFEPMKFVSSVRLPDELKHRPFEVLVVDAQHAVAAIGLARTRQPQVPVIVVGGQDAAAEAQALARGASYLARPLDRALFSCTIAMAVMESRPVRRSERKPARFEVLVHGVPSRIVDVSREGLRLEIPRLRKVGPPPPLFDVAVPMLGVSVNVRRLWTSNPPEMVGQTIWYGGELSNNTKRVELAWFTLVDALPGSRVSLGVQ